MKLEQGVRLARYTTLGTGGPATAFARPETLDELQEALAFARDRELAGRCGRARLEPARRGRRVRRRRPQARRRARPGGGARRAARRGRRSAERRRPPPRARGAGLGGFEFACAIPGTAGGGVWMNAGAYGGDWAGILERALVVDAEGARWLARDELGLQYRRSGLAPGRRSSQRSSSG